MLMIYIINFNKPKTAMNMAVSISQPESDVTNMSL